MDWDNFLFGLFLIGLGMISGGLLLWAWLTWPITAPDDDDETQRRAEAQNRHPSSHPEVP